MLAGEVDDTLFLNGPVELVEPLHLQAVTGLAVHSDEDRMVSVLGEVATDDHVVGPCGQSRKQAGVDVAEDAGGVLQELGHVLLPEYILGQGPPRFFPLVRREVRVGVAREVERSVVALGRVLTPRVQVVEPAAAVGRGDQRRPPHRLGDGRTDGVVPDLLWDPRRLIDHDATEAEAENGLRIVGGEKEDAGLADRGRQFGADRVAANDGKHVAGDLAERLDAAFSDEVGRGDPAVVPSPLESGAVEYLRR